MEPNEINRIAQYVTARTSHSREVIEDIIRTGLGELEQIGTTSSSNFHRNILFEYITLWTISKTSQPEPMVREVFECAGRWLDSTYETIVHNQPELLERPDI